VAGFSIGTTLGHTVTLLVIASGSGCASRGVTANKLEVAVAATFANLIQVQEAMLEMPPVDATDLRASATCRRIGPGADPAGGGDWACTLHWFVPGRKLALHETYDLSVSTDGCYTATTEGADAHVGGARLATRHGSVTNLLYVFNGCFDTT